jgi:hypothetical protein
MRTTDG